MKKSKAITTILLISVLNCQQKGTMFALSFEQQFNVKDKSSLPKAYCNNAVLSSWTNANGLSCQDFIEDPSLCDTEKNLYSINDGRTASTACCACGGGVWSNMTLVKEITYDYDYHSNHTNSNSSSNGSASDGICINRYGWEIERESLGNEPLTCDTFQSSDQNSEFSCYRYGAIDSLKELDTPEEAVSN